MKLVSKLYTATSSIGNAKRELEKKYRPLNNIVDGTSRNSFTTDKLDIDLNTSTEMLAYPSYDGSVNLFITNDKNEPFVINSGFAKLEDGSCKIIERMGDDNTNEYSSDTLNQQVKLFTVVDKYPKILLKSVDTGGQLIGGNYTLYFKYADKDGNKTDIVGESSIISIFYGDYNSIPTIKGTLSYERTDKTMSITLSDVDPRFSKLYVYVHWTSSDLDGNPLSSTYELIEPFNLDGNDEFTFTINGTEETKEISIDDLNIQYNLYNSAKTQTTVQNMLFLGNLGQSRDWSGNNIQYDSLDLAKLTWSEISTKCVQKDDIGYVSDRYTDATITTKNSGEYYNPKNIYERLGYWPDELYRFGIVYIFEDGSRSRVFNLTGGHIKSLTDTIYGTTEFNDDFNKYGVFRTPHVAIISDSSIRQQSVKPLAFEFTISDYALKQLKDIYKVKAYYFVRQKRLPITIAQGLSIGVNRNTGVPTPLVYEDFNETYLPYKQSDDAIGFVNNKHISGNYYKCESFLAHVFEEGGHHHWNTGFIFPGDTGNYIKNLSNEHYHKIMPGVSQTVKNFKGLVPASLGITPNAYNKTYKNKPYNNGKEWIYTFSQSDKIDIKTSSLWNSYFTSNLHYGLLCVDSYCVPQVQSLMRGDLYLTEYLKYYTSDTSGSKSGIRYKNRSTTNTITLGEFEENPSTHKYTVNYIDVDSSKQTIYKEAINPLGDVPRLYSKNDERLPKQVSVFFPYCTKIGSSKQVSECKSLFIDMTDPQMRQLFENASHATNDAADLIRGYWAAFIGIAPAENNNAFPALIDQQGMFNDVYYGYDKITVPSTLYNIRTVDLSDNDKYVLERKKREVSTEMYYSTSDIFNITDENIHTIYRGDCFTCTTSTRMQWNFIDPEVGLADTFVDTETWRNNFGGVWGKPEKGRDNSLINRGDINAIHLGYWLTYKSLSNYNLGLRSEDKTHSDEQQSIGNFRSFYPLRGADRSSGNKLPDSNKLNIGYSTTTSVRKNIGWKETPYEMIDYSNRIAFSNMQISKAFENNFKVFQALSYQDIDSTYGNIIKFEPFGSDIFCVFEHGCGIIPINEKALMQTTTGSMIHIYGTGVIGESIQVISPNYGSTWHDSIIRTPNGIYGVDASACKIWKYSGQSNFTLISDLRVQRFLNEEMVITTNDMFVGVNNIKTHYNASKGDVMFTFYNADKVWNLCYNELLDMFTCKYTWVPLESGNINNTFVSIPLQSNVNFDDSNNEQKYSIFEHKGIGNLPQPTNWYGKQHPFELEFVVSQPTGVQKIYDNLVILSNNVQPDSLEITITGDNYDFTGLTEFPNIVIKNDIKVSTIVSKDTLSDDILYTLNQKCLNIKDWGRRIGNIEHKEDVWYATLQPITIKTNLITSQTRVRGMWAKIRIKYTGDELATITSIMTLLRLSNG